MAKNQYYTKAYVSQALMHQHSMVVRNKYIKLISNFNDVDYALVQRVNENGHLISHLFIIIDEFWYSDDKRKVNAITLIKK